MDRYDVTVFKSGNSYALRVPKRYVDDQHLKEGDKLSIAAPIRQKKQNRAKIQQLFLELQHMHAFASIKDPAAWQREIRKDRPLPGRD